MGLLDGKVALIFGVANKNSIAWGITKALHEAGAALAAGLVRRSKCQGSLPRSSDPMAYCRSRVAVWQWTTTQSPVLPGACARALFAKCTIADQAPRSTCMTGSHRPWPAPWRASRVFWPRGKPGPGV